MNKNLQTKHKNIKNAYNIIIALQELDCENSQINTYELCSTLFGVRFREGLPLNDHIIKMVNILRQLDVYRVVISKKLKVNLILQPILYSYKPFITNHNLNSIERMLLELLNEI